MALFACMKNILVDDRGTSAVEYGLIISLVVLAMTAALQGVANATIDMWSDVKSDVVDASN